MKKPTGAILLFLAIVLSSLGQGTVRLVTHPVPPSRESLQRMGLVQGWRVQVPTERLRDGLFSVQVIPWDLHPQVVVQTFAGDVILLDGETGDILWRNNPGTKYWALQPVAYNSHSIFTTRRDVLYILDRATGAQRLFDTDKLTKERDYGMRLLGNPIAGLVADEEQLYLSLGGRIISYDVPNYDIAARAIKAIKEEVPPDKDNSLRPIFKWSYLLANQVAESLPIVNTNRLGAMATDGTLMSFNKFEGIYSFDFKTTGNVSAPLGQYDEIAYIGSEDYALYAVNTVTDRLLWRFVSGGTMLRKPAVNDIDVFQKVERAGLYRVDRQTGRGAWLNKDADRFLAANHRFVYTLDSRGHMLILDHTRGTVLGKYDLSDWQMPVANELTDRIYVANHDGQVLCLFHKDNPRPLRMKAVEWKIKGKDKKPMDKDKDKAKGDDKMGAVIPAKDIHRPNPHMTALAAGVPPSGGTNRLKPGLQQDDRAGAPPSGGPHAP